MTAQLPFAVDEALAYLRGVDPVLAGVIDKVGPYDLRPREDPYHALIRAILYQQLAGAAAATIERRFMALYGDAGLPPTPQQLLETSDEALRSTGVSRQKASYLKDLALHVMDGRLQLDALPVLSDEEVMRELVAVKGIGEWSAHMFLMFHLARPDVLPVGDLGVRNGMRLAYGLGETPTPAQAKEIGNKWAPYRSVGSWYMWRVIEPGGDI